MLHTNKLLMIIGLIMALVVLVGCTKEVVTEVVVTATPDPAAAGASTAVTTTEATPEAPVAAAATEVPATAEPQQQQQAEADDVEYVYQIGISADLTTTNYWAYLGPDGTVWNLYVLGGDKPVLFAYSAQRFDWVPSLAADFPTALQEETTGGTDFLDHGGQPEGGCAVERRHRSHRRGLRIHRSHCIRNAAVGQLAVGGGPGVLRPCGGAGPLSVEDITSRRSRDWHAGSSGWRSCPSFPRAIGNR